MTKEQAEQFAAYTNEDPSTPFESATVEHDLPLGKNGYFVRMGLHDQEEICDDWKTAQECMGLAIPVND